MTDLATESGKRLSPNTGVLVGTRRVGEKPSGGGVKGLLLALVDVETGEITNPSHWDIRRPGRFTMQVDPDTDLMQVSKMAERYTGALISDTGEADETILSLNEATQAAEKWWTANLGTDRYTEPKPRVLGFNIELSRQWLIQWCPPLSERFGPGFDLLSVAWGLGMTIPESFDTYTAELEQATLVTKAVASR